MRSIFVLVSMMFAFNTAHAADGPDMQTPAELARAHARIAAEFAGAIVPSQLSKAERAWILSRYDYLDPHHNVPAKLLKTAVLYFDQNKSRFTNQNFITVVDFTPRSDHYRFFVVNMKNGSVEQFHTTHGEGSDPNQDGYADTFGNVINSGKSSLGFIRTAEVYVGHYKRSLRLDGLSPTDSNLRDRAVVVHGWDYVHEANVLQGLTLGCMALDWKIKDHVIDEIQGGSLIYAGLSGPTRR